MRILAVDDDENICELLREALISTGDHQVTSAEGGAQALQIIDQADQPFDCLLLDIQMPGINGIELCRAVRAMDDYRLTPIVMLTAMSQKKYIDQAFEAGATDYVTKPFDFLELFSRLNVAQQLVDELAIINNGIQQVAEMQHDLDNNLQQDLAEPVQITDVDRLVGYVAFENYLMQLSRSKLFRSSVFAVKIDAVEAAHDSASPLEFRHLLNRVARTLSDCTAREGNLISYRGNGIFLCVVHGRSLFSQDEFEATINQTLGRLSSIQIGDSKTCLLVGELVSLRSLTKSGALQSLRQAVDRVEYRENQDDPVIDAMQQATDSKRQHNGSNDVEKQAYEVLLRDALEEQSSNSNALFERFARRRLSA